MTPTPIILIHRGDSYYLAHTIAQSRSSNPDSRLILLGDRSNSFYLGVEHHRYEDYFCGAREFAKLYTYDYFPNYQYPWILFCHQKYFALRDFIRAQGIERFLIIDSDVLLYEPVGPYFEYYRDYRMTLSSGASSHSAQAAFTVVNDPSILGSLCQIYSDFFRSSPKSLQDRYGTEFLTEMLGLGLLMRDPQNRIKNTYEESEVFVVNHNLLDDLRFEKDGECARIFWKDSTPLFRALDTDKLLKSPIIHFHGHTKNQMGKYLHIKSLRLRLEHFVNCAISASAKYPMRWTNQLTGRAMFPGL